MYKEVVITKAARVWSSTVQSHSHLSSNSGMLLYCHPQIEHSTISSWNAWGLIDKLCSSEEWPRFWLNSVIRCSRYLIRADFFNVIPFHFEISNQRARWDYIKLDLGKKSACRLWAMGCNHPIQSDLAASASLCPVQKYVVKYQHHQTSKLLESTPDGLR